MKTLKDVTPTELFSAEYEGTKAQSFENIMVVREHSRGWPGKHKNVHVWWELVNGYAVAWNENPGRGWSFPTIKLKKG